MKNQIQMEINTSTKHDCNNCTRRADMREGEKRIKEGGTEGIGIIEWRKLFWDCPFQDTNAPKVITFYRISYSSPWI